MADWELYDGTWQTVNCTAERDRLCIVLQNISKIGIVPQNINCEL